MKLHYRSIWISDTHLGTRGCKAEYLRDFLDHTESDYLYLVGDIIDFWKFKTGAYWPMLHSDIVQRIINKAQNGTRVIYIPGNHDEVFRKHAGMHFNGIDIQLNAVHTTEDGRKFLVLHGDEFDSIVCHNKSLAYIGGEAYEVLLLVNRWFNAVRTRLGYKYWSLSAFLKHKVKNVVSFMTNYQHILSLEAQKRKVDGIICGHIHHADIATMEFGKTYCNCGDWVESCTALTEDEHGTLSIVRWLEDSHVLLDDAVSEDTGLAQAA
ncbi:UDP-2,3-diacylglucosamine diphosphatase [Methylotuvimicrobium alcaliphilum]|uniref:Metallo-dependent phosphatase n=1 Tax=Methylotuvimicrobium alcaliphilum (strain DSM 19304 / NCIMB 14124 / VKM B-2133 / 20Z) TaxID=1091494 RepID=G4SZ08_META2|nr:UDP-2,3-diacylglucosamine diphosphatase [Methylotuvimicrobium alcaliphilum]CCE25465.1 putative Metallo-dependent phosphatase [Methylotuvimicrobium alcaliphilum 20Z]HBA65926.1 UDP-2,3-diacylglucosamine diphosphatase [Methylococcaceae bacterium]